MFSMSSDDSDWDKLNKLSKEQLVELYKHVGLELKISMKKSHMIEEILNLEDNHIYHTKHLNCPYCDWTNTIHFLPKGDWVYHSCYNCDAEINETISPARHRHEALHFLKNNVLLLLVPIMAAYCFELYPEWRVISGLVFGLSLSILSVAYHEFFHAIVAYHFGDYTMYGKGYLRLNIFKYFNNFTSLLFPLIGFALFGIFLPGAAVYISLQHVQTSAARSFVYFSGIIANVLMLLILTYLLNSELLSLNEGLISLLQTVAFIQIVMIVFNLLPIPGLDGWGVIAPIFDQSVRDFLQKYSIILVLGFFAILITFGEANDLWFFYLDILVTKVGLDWEQIGEGFYYLKIIDVGDYKICSIF